jgi:DNA-binding transcriptional LysR family regulator
VLDFDLNLLRIALAIHDEGSVSGAALRLNMSQPAASSALKKLRQAIGDPLFIKTADGMAPTPRAISLIHTARDMLTQLSMAVDAGESFDPAKSHDTFAFAMSDIGEMVFLPRILEYVSGHAPNASVRSVTLPPVQLEAGLQDGTVDLAVGHFPDLKKSIYYQQRLFTHRFVCLLRKGHPFLSRKLTLDQFLALGHVVVHAEGRSQEIIERFLDKERIRRRIVLHTPHFMSIPMIIARSDLVATVPHALGVYLSQSGDGVEVIDPPFDLPTFALKQHWHRKYHHEPKSLWLRKVVSELFNDDHDEWRD